MFIERRVSKCVLSVLLHNLIPFKEKKARTLSKEKVMLERRKP